MDTIHPLAGSLLSSAQAQRVAQASKARQVRRSQLLRRNSASTGDEAEPQVDSADGLSPIREETPQRKRSTSQPGKKKSRLDDDDSGDPLSEHIDITA